ncbi:MAG: hypothetical protein CMM26_12390 [Rhodospirillaceae bacterium]|nr:hypothetical protein [Rhodospirillaceae bacterium]
MRQNLAHEHLDLVDPRVFWRLSIVPDQAQIIAWNLVEGVLPIGDLLLRHIAGAGYQEREEWAVDVCVELLVLLGELLRASIAGSFYAFIKIRRTIIEWRPPD